MRNRPVAGIVLSLVVTATAVATTADRIDPSAGRVGPAPALAARAAPGDEPEPAPREALPPPPGRTVLVSRKRQGPAAPFLDASSIEPSASADGTFVAFTSIASDLVPGDEPGTLDVFVIDRRTNTARRAPRPQSPLGIGSSRDPSISADGRVVAFTWLAPAPPPPPPTAPPTAPPTDPPIFLRATIPETYVFAWDLRTNRIEPVSRTSRGTRLPGASQPSVSANGRYIAYTTMLDVGIDQDDGAEDVLRFDRRTGETILLTLDPSGRPSSGSASQPSISGDGSKVAFISNGNDTVVSEATGEGYQVYVRDIPAGRTTRVSASFDGGPARGQSEEPAISQDGRFVAFTSIATNLVDGPPSRFPQVYRRDLDAGRTELVSVTPAGLPGEGTSLTPAITADGAMVAFTSTDGNLASSTASAGGVAPAAVVRGPSEVYLRDIAASETVLVSVSLDRVRAGGRSLQPAVAALGRFTFFASDSDRLVANDPNKATDVFVRDLPPMPVLNPAQLDLGSRAVGIESAPLAAVLSNAGWSALGVTGASIGGPNAKDFRIASDGCRDRTLGRNEACTVSVLFKPGARGARTATLTVTDNLPTSTLTVSLRGRGSLARLEVNPEVGRPGMVVMVEGSGFPAGAGVTLRWSRGITARADQIVARGGRFRVPVLVFHNDLLGRRELIAEPTTPGTFPPVSVPVLITEASAIPPQFSMLRFIDVPLVLVIRG